MRNEPVPGEGMAGDARGVAFHALFPLREIDRAGERCEHHKLRKGQFRLIGHRGGRIKSLRPVAGQAEDKRAQHMNVMPAKRLKAMDQALSREIEVLEYVL